METLILDAHRERDIQRAGAILNAGGLVAIPTETVYGLAANALREEAVRGIFAAKGRPGDNPLIVHISAVSQMYELAQHVPEEAVRLAEAFWPGPLTIILPKRACVPDITSGGLKTVALRLPDHKVARAVIEAAGVPLAAPSANLSGRPSPTAFSHVQQDLTGRVDALIDGGDCPVGVESTVVSLCGGKPALLRPGGVTLQALRDVLGDIAVDPAVLEKLTDGRTAASPGMKYTHYAPKAKIIMVDASPVEYAAYVNEKADGHALCFEEDVPRLQVPQVCYGTRYDGAGQARRLFSALHELDAAGAGTAYAHIPSKNGMGLAVYNRLVRAAGFRMKNPGGHHVVGLTGPSGAGKTAVAKIMEKLGCGVVDCDEITRAPGIYDAACLKELQAAFGEDVVQEGALNRGLLAARAFRTEEGKELLNRITHPRILGGVMAAYEAHVAAGCRVIVFDAPTLFEAGLDSYCSRILAVVADAQTRLSRIMRRDGLDEASARLRMQAQQELSFFVNRADHVVENSRDGGDLNKRLGSIVGGLREKAEG